MLAELVIFLDPNVQSIKATEIIIRKKKTTWKLESNNIRKKQT